MAKTPKLLSMRTELKVEANNKLEDWQVKNITQYLNVCQTVLGCLAVAQVISLAGPQSGFDFPSWTLFYESESWIM